MQLFQLNNLTKVSQSEDLLTNKIFKGTTMTTNNGITYVAEKEIHFVFQ